MAGNILDAISELLATREQPLQVAKATRHGLAPHIDDLRIWQHEMDQTDVAKVIRHFEGNISAALSVSSTYVGNFGLIQMKITNPAATHVQVSILDAYTGRKNIQTLQPHGTLAELSLDEFFGWYDLIVIASADPTFKYRLAGHVESGQDSFSDPALGGLVTLKG